MEAAKNILVVGSETMSKIVDWNDRSTAILFADGAGAVILSADKTQELNTLNSTVMEAIYLLFM